MRRPSRQGLLPLWNSSRQWQPVTLIIRCGEISTGPAAFETEVRFQQYRPTQRQHIFVGKPRPQIAVGLWITFVVALLSAVFSESYGQPAEDRVAGYFGLIRDGSASRIPHLEVSEPLIASIGLYIRDSSADVRTKACELLHRLTVRSSDPVHRQAAVNVMLIRYQEGVEANMYALLIAFLQQYQPADYSQTARKILSELISEEVVYLDRLLKIAGYVGLKESLSDMRAWAQPGNPAPIRWAALLSLSRLGDVHAIREVTERAGRFPINDDTVYQLFPDLVYTRAKEAMAYVVEALHDPNPKCLSADLERETPIECGYRIMELIAPVIEDFPLSLDGSGDLAVSDYPGALRTVRQWFLDHPDYRISNHTF